MKAPRKTNASDLIRARRVSGYERVRQDGSHIRLTTTVGGTHHVTIPNHRPLKTGTLLGGGLNPVAAHHKLTVEEFRPGSFCISGLVGFRPTDRNRRFCNL